MDPTAVFEEHRPRLRAMARRILADDGEAEDVVQQTWLRWRAAEDLVNPAGWLTTVTSRLCLDRLRAHTPVPVERVEDEAAGEVCDPVDEVVLAEAVGTALQVVLDRLSPRERVAFVLHDSFGVAFATVAAVLDTTPTTARKLASRARGKVAGRGPGGGTPDAEVVDAFMAAARDGEFGELLALLAPDAAIDADAAAVAVGTPDRIEGRREVAAFFDGAAHAALPVLVGDRPGAAWFDRGAAAVLFDFRIRDGLVHRITFRAAPEVLVRVTRRR